MDVVGGGGMLRKGEGETRKGQDMRERESEEGRGKGEGKDEGGKSGAKRGIVL